jgi:hypothetical protein
MNREARSWVWGSTPVGCLARSAIMIFIPIVIGLWGLDQYLHWQAAQRAAGRPGSPAVAHPGISLSVDLSRPLAVAGVVLVLVLVVALIRRWAPQQLQHRLYRGLQILGGILALLQPGLVLGAAITAAVCRERPRAFRFLVRGCAAVPAILMVVFGAWCWGWSLLVVTGRVSIGQAVGAAAVEVLLGGFWLRLYVDLTSTAEAEMKIAKLGKRMQARFERAAAANPIHPPFWQRTRRHPEGSIDLGVDRVRGRALRVPIASLRRHATLVGVTASGKTVTIARIVDGVLSQPLPWAVIVVDCKGGELQDTAEDLARTHEVPFQEVNPGRPGSLRYDIAQLGSPAEIADKLTAAFPSTPEAGIYRDTSYHALVHAAAAHLSVSGKVELEELEAALDQSSLNQLAGQVREPGTGHPRCSSRHRGPHEQSSTHRLQRY